MRTSFKQYVRDRNNRRKGLIVAELHGKELQIGWSLCKTTGANPDQFNRAQATSIANRRRDSKKYTCEINSQDSIGDMIFSKRGKNGGCDETDNIPHSIRRTMHRVIDRSIYVSQKQQEQVTA